MNNRAKSIHLPKRFRSAEEVEPSTPDIFENPEFEAFTSTVLKFIGKRKRTRCSALNKRFKNGYWLNLALDKLTHDGLIENVSKSVLFTEYAAGGREITKLAPVSKEQYITSVGRSSKASVYVF